MGWTWDFWRREATAGDLATDRKAEHRSGMDREEDWESRLRDVGLPENWAARLSASAEQAAKELGPEAELGLMRGIVLVVNAQSEILTQLEGGMRDAREVERLLGAFGGELKKLDEVLDVLSAYAQRMRSKPASGLDKKGRRVLH